MNNKLYLIGKKDLFDLLERLSVTYRIFAPYAKKDKLYFAEFDIKNEADIELGGIKQSQPAKSFFSPPRETVMNGQEKNSKPVMLIGVKSCDLESFDVQDFVFRKGDFEDPFYIKNKDSLFIISHDCTYGAETCFCTAVDGAPYPKKNFDINLSPVGDDFLVETASAKGLSLINEYKMFFKAPPGGAAGERDAKRRVVTEEVNNFITKRGTPDSKSISGAVKKSYDMLDMWKDFSSTCVECGACNFVCPTCHCFLLHDDKKDSESKRTRIWDSCLYKTFARVAGGANPRRHLYERLRNRFDKKFDFFPQVLGKYACTGCGRCIEACAGDIDIREVLKGLVSGKWNKPPHK